MYVLRPYGSGIAPATFRPSKFGNKNMYPVSAVKAITHARSMNETVAGYCKRKSKVDKNLPNAYDNDSKESV